MKLAVLSRNPELYSTKRLIEAGRKRGHAIEIVDFLRCRMTIASSEPDVVYQGRPMGDIQAIIPRIGVSATFYGCAVVRQFEMMGTYSVNPAQAITRSRDKLRALQILARKGVGLPVTGMAHSVKDIDGLIASVGGTPLVVKLLEGTQGIGIVLCETDGAARSVIEAFRGLDANILVQQFVAESKGSDIRAFVVGDRVVASMKRQGAPGEFRSNLHRGGHAQAEDLSVDERKTALAAAEAMGLRVAGVDMLRSNDGPVVMEVNSSPGLEGIETYTGADVAGAIIDFVVANASRGSSDDLLRH